MKTTCVSELQAELVALRKNVTPFLLERMINYDYSVVAYFTSMKTVANDKVTGFK